MHAPTRILTIYFDGGCPLCRREIRWYQHLRTREPVAWVDLDERRGEPPAPDLGFEQAMRLFHARCPSAGLLVGVDGFIRLWQAFPVLRPLALIASFRPIKAVLGKAYEVFAARRWRKRCADGACGLVP